jgi:hypothetical protein
MTNSDYPLTIRALQIALGDNDNGALEWADTYGEPGYTDPEKVILFANWNEVERTLEARHNERNKVTCTDENKLTDYEAPRARDVWRSLERRLERLGYKIEWSDEWMIDHDNGAKAYRTQPDHNGWESRVRAGDGYYLTPDTDAQEWIDDALNEEGRPLPSWFDESELETRGFAVIDQDDKAVGFHPGQTDDPHKFMPALNKEGYDVVLQITGLGQFDAHYKIWTRREAKREILFDEASGIYIPKRFADEMDRARVVGVSASDYETLEAGPDHEHYWEVWAEVLRLATITGTDGTKYSLEQDGTVFLVENGGEYCEQEDTYYVHK